VLARVAVAEDTGGGGDRGSRQPADKTEEADGEGPVFLESEDAKRDVVRPSPQDRPGRGELETPDVRISEDVSERRQRRTNAG
jgi:hypothetical protein